MKKILILLCFLSANLFAQSPNSLNVDSEIEKVLVFLKGAQINRKAKVQIPKGKTELVFVNLAGF